MNEYAEENADSLAKSWPAFCRVRLMCDCVEEVESELLQTSKKVLCWSYESSSGYFSLESSKNVQKKKEGNIVGDSSYLSSVWGSFLYESWRMKGLLHWVCFCYLAEYVIHINFMITG